MRRLIAGFLVALAFCAPRTSQGQIDPAVARAHGPLLDSLAMLLGPLPTVEVRPLLAQHGSIPRAGAWIIIVRRASDRPALLHEFGHYAAFIQPTKWMAIADSLGLDVGTASTRERLAEVFVGLVEQRSTKDVALATRIFERPEH